MPGTSPWENVIAGPTLRGFDGDYLLQMADFIAHALHKQEGTPIPPGSMAWESTKPFPSSTDPLTGRPLDETARGSSGDEGGRKDCV